MAFGPDLSESVPKVQIYELRFFTDFRLGRIFPKPCMADQVGWNCGPFAEGIGGKLEGDPVIPDDQAGFCQEKSTSG